MITKLLFAAILLFQSAAPAVQAPQPATPTAEYNATFCGVLGHGSEHIVVTADKKSLDFLYYIEENQVVKDESKDGSHIIFALDTYEELENHLILIHGTTVVPDGAGNPPVNADFRGTAFGTRIVGVVKVDNKVRFAMYGNLGPVDELIKIDQSAAGQTCVDLVTDGLNKLAQNLINWLRFGTLTPKGESNGKV